jgi:hypothetical protein
MISKISEYFFQIMAIESCFHVPDKNEVKLHRQIPQIYFKLQLLEEKYIINDYMNNKSYISKNNQIIYNDNNNFN